MAQILAAATLNPNSGEVSVRVREELRAQQRRDMLVP